jgi:hypothetical protein
MLGVCESLPWSRRFAGTLGKEQAMPSIAVDTQTEIELDPGKTVHRKWNNAAPVNAVWSANAVPSITGSTPTGWDQDTSLEITRLWRRLLVIEKAPPGSQISDTTIEHEIHYEIKNVGNDKARFRIFLSAVW